MFDKKVYMKKYNQEHYAQQKEWARQHPEKMYASRERCKNKHPDYQKNKRKEYKQRIDAYNHNYNLNNKTKRKAEKWTSQKPLLENCEICESKENLLHHHPDYSEPSIYVTLCSSCHRYVHNSEVKRGEEMRKDACIFCKKIDFPCHDGRRNLGKTDEPCEGFEKK